MRILFLTHNMAGLGGSFLRAFSLGRALAKMNHEVTLVASRRERGFRRLRDGVDGLEILQMPDWFPERARHGGLSPIDLLGRLSLFPSFDVIHGFDHRPAVSIPALWLRRWARAPYVADWADLWGEGGIAEERPTYPGRLLGKMDHYWERRVHRRADAVTVVTEELGTRAEELGIARSRLRCIGVGANDDLVRPLPRAAMRAKHGVPERAPVVVHSGFAPYDWDLLVATVAALARRNPAVLFVFTGPRDPRLLQALGAAAGGRMRHFGVVPYEQLGEILACGDVMILPYTGRTLNQARFPNRVGDYLAAGRPFVTNPTGALGRLVEREGVGLLADETPEAIALAAAELLADEPRRRQMGERARALSETRLSWRTVATELDLFYRELVERPAALASGAAAR